MLHDSIGTAKMAVSAAIVGVLLVVFVLYRQAFPRPFWGIPYNATSAKQFWGDTTALFDTIKITQDPAKFIFQQNRNLGSPVIQMFLAPFSNPTVIIDDIREVKDILSNRTLEFDRAPRTQDAYRALLPHCSLVKQTGAAFKNQRRFWEGVTSTPFLKRIAEPKIVRCALELIELFKAQAATANGRPFECFHNFDVAAFEVIWEVVFGEEGGAINSAREDVLRARQTSSQPESLDSPAVLPAIEKPEMCKSVAFFITQIAKSLKSVAQTWHLWLLQNQPEYKRRLAFKRNKINRLIENTHLRLRNLPEKDLKELNESSALVLGVRRHILADIGQGKPADSPLSPLAREEIHDELFMLLVAGHETKAVLLSWAVKFLFAYPEKQEKLRQALLNALPIPPGSKTPPIESINGTSIPYLQAYMEESMRVANTSPRLVRQTTATTSVLGHSIPKGTTVILNPYIGTEPLDISENLRSETSQKAKDSFQSYWDPTGMDDFVPERWLTEDGSFNPRQFPRLAFSAGPRMCYGT
ncbi:hypothetical protein NLG97_g984 [Lecanicillium saksenae]|uniref:Uncharacterized protein n=1 Tax=Lecanicillium saksenae TaxID=468837 RepID=A0ACC1R4Z7_9HYPO|nr:hypothetical protein NLG97_g984 [Lecanicillium saksenae]